MRTRIAQVAERRARIRRSEVRIPVLVQFFLLRSYKVNVWPKNVFWRNFHFVPQILPQFLILLIMRHVVQCARLSLIPLHSITSHSLGDSVIFVENPRVKKFSSLTNNAYCLIIKYRWGCKERE